MDLVEVLKPIIIGAVLGVPLHQATAAHLPPHRQLRVLIVSDYVNPNGLPPDELTEPGDISAALRQPAAGVNLDPADDGVVEIPTNDLPIATAAISVPADDPAAYDVVVYFSHRAPNDGSSEENAADQAAFVAAAEAFVQNGGGFVSFHHGFFAGSGKAEMMHTIIGAQGGGYAWNTVSGQNVINVAPGHFVTSHSVEYPQVLAYAAPALGVPPDVYTFFNNTPDERYTLHAVFAAPENIETLFASDYDVNGTAHLLGFTHQEPDWQGKVVVYQPGEYQPNALDDLNGNNFQIFANEIVYSANALLPCPSDVNQNGGVGINDFIAVLGTWGPCTGYCPADVNGDGMVDAVDLALVRDAWGPCLNGD